MGIYYADGPWSYRSTVGGALVVTSTQRLLALRVFASGTTGSFTIDVGGTTGEPIQIAANSGFDWSPSGKVVNSTVTFSSTDMQWFAEIEKLISQ